MTELPNETLAGDRGITPVGEGDNGRTAMLKRGFGALALTAFAFLIIWGTWKGDKPVTDSARKLMIRQAAAFEPVAGYLPHRSPRHPFRPRRSLPRQRHPRPHRTRCSKARGARRCWPITGRSHRGVRPATA
jgi:type IV secretion system protein VirB10